MQIVFSLVSHYYLAIFYIFPIIIYNIENDIHGGA